MLFITVVFQDDPIKIKCLTTAVPNFSLLRDRANLIFRTKSISTTNVMETLRNSQVMLCKGFWPRTRGLRLGYCGKKLWHGFFEENGIDWYHELSWFRPPAPLTWERKSYVYFGVLNYNSEMKCKIKTYIKGSKQLETSKTMFYKLPAATISFFSNFKLKN